MLIVRLGSVRVLLAYGIRAERALSLCVSHHQSKDVSSSGASAALSTTLTIGNETFQRDSLTNVTPRILQKFGRRLLNQRRHPLNLLKLRIVDFFNAKYARRLGNPLFSVFEDLSPVVTPSQNFDNLCVPKNHVSRSPKDTYYVNKDHLLRCHTTAHDFELINMGVDAFLIFGDVYRRDAIDSTHYPVFHQSDGVRLFTEKELFASAKDPHKTLRLFESDAPRSVDRQDGHSMETAKMLEFELKSTLEGLAQALFGTSVTYRWVDAYFPFTHPSWEMEVLFNGEWIEMLGCGILEQRIVSAAGAPEKVGWAFGVGMERWAMRLYNIPDIRVFWSDDPSILKQFEVENLNDVVFFKPVSVYPPCIADISFWIPAPSAQGDFNSNDFYDVVRSVGGDQVEEVHLVDEFVHPKTSRCSHCYRITYRDMCRTLTQAEANKVHAAIASAAADMLGVEIR